MDWREREREGGTPLCSTQNYSMRCLQYHIKSTCSVFITVR